MLIAVYEHSGPLLCRSIRIRGKIVADGEALWDGLTFGIDRRRAIDSRNSSWPSCKKLAATAV